MLEILKMFFSSFQRDIFLIEELRSLKSKLISVLWWRDPVLSSPLSVELNSKCFLINPSPGLRPKSVKWSGKFLWEKNYKFSWNDKKSHISQENGKPKVKSKLSDCHGSIHLVLSPPGGCHGSSEENSFWNQ